MAQAERSVQQLFDLSGKVRDCDRGGGVAGRGHEPGVGRGRRDDGGHQPRRRPGRGVCRVAARYGHVGLAFAQDDMESIPGFVADVAAQLGRIDVLVNNAYGGTAPTIESATAEDFDRAYHTGVTAYFLLAREVVRHLRGRQAPGSIINIASMYGVVASYPEAYTDLPFNSPPNYHGLKGGIVHLTRHLAVYWAEDRVRVNAIAPGPFPSPKVRARSPEFIERLSQRVPMGRMGEPEELKGMVVLLASDAGSYITGQNISGGRWLDGLVDLLSDGSSS